MNDNSQNQQPIVPQSQPVAPPVISQGQPAAPVGIGYTPDAGDSLSTWGGLMFWSLIPAIIVAPAWISLGRTMFGVYGWFMIILSLSVGPIMFIYHIIIAVLGANGTTKQALTNTVSTLVSIYYVMVFICGLAIVDGGDAPGSTSSVLTLVGVSEDVSYVISLLTALVIAALMVIIFILMLIDTNRAQKIKRQNRVAAMPVLPQQ